MKQLTLCWSYTGTELMRPNQLAAKFLLQVICEVAKLFNLPGTLKDRHSKMQPGNHLDRLGEHVRARNEFW